MTHKKIGDIWFPEEEQHFLQYPDAARYQQRQRKVAMRYVKDFDLALDVGAHVGIFSRYFASKFKRVIAVEPVLNLQELIAMNCPENVEILPVALSDESRSATMCKLSTTNSGCSFIFDDFRVHPANTGSVVDLIEVDMKTIDSLELPSVGLIKVDVQGSDHLVVAGGMRTIERCKPVLLIEEKPVGGPNGPVAHIYEIHRMLVSIGATVGPKVGADRIFYFQ